MDKAEEERRQEAFATAVEEAYRRGVSDTYKKALKDATKINCKRCQDLGEPVWHEGAHAFFHEDAEGKLHGCDSEHIHIHLKRIHDAH